MTKTEINALPPADQIQIHDLYDAAAGDQPNRFEDSEFTRLAHVCENCACGDGPR